MGPRPSNTFSHTLRFHTTFARKELICGGDMPLQNMFWGDRYGKLTDPFGQQWGISTHIEDVAPEDMKRRQEAFFSKAAVHS
jgi:uncharacterized glyoxalase superfamily protein PhnB